MARTSSQKLDFWQFEVGLFNDMKMVELNEKYGALGEAVYFRILSYIANSEGYYAVLSDSLILSIYRSIGSKWIKDKRVILRIIDYCGECGLFDVSLLSQNVITSCGIQRRWLYAKEKARAKGFTTDKFWLLNGQGFVKCTQNKNKCSNNDDKCNINTDNCDNNSLYKSKVKSSQVPPNPLQGGEGENWKERFFERYPIFERKNYNDAGIDYKVLYDEFEKSSTLQKLWSFPKVIKLYQQIAEGRFRDMKTNNPIALLDERVAREKWYADRRNTAINAANKILDRFMENEEFRSIKKRLNFIPCEIAKAEVAYEANKADIKAKKKLISLTQEENILKQRQWAILSFYEMTEEDLLPKWHCKKCEDTGFLKDGSGCDCYEMEESP